MVFGSNADLLTFSISLEYIKNSITAFQNVKLCSKKRHLASILSIYYLLVSLQTPKKIVTKKTSHKMMTSSSKDLKVFGEYQIRYQGCQYQLNLESAQIIKGLARGVLGGPIIWQIN